MFINDGAVWCHEIGLFYMTQKLGHIRKSIGRINKQNIKDNGGDISAYYRYAFIPEREGEEVDENVTTNQLQARLGLSYLPTRWMTLRLGYTFNKYISSDDDDYTENRGLLTITLAPDQPWRF